jgi:hypothetical protein
MNSMVWQQQRWMHKGAKGRSQFDGLNGWTTIALDQGGNQFTLPVA